MSREYQLARLPHDCFVGGRILLDQPLDEIEEAHARTIALGVDIGSIAGQLLTGLNKLLVGFGVIRIINKRGEDDGACCR